MSLRNCYQEPLFYVQIWVQCPHNATGYYTIYGDDSGYQVWSMMLFLLSSVPSSDSLVFLLSYDRIFH